jgi:hypothetical protein
MSEVEIKMEVKIIRLKTGEDIIGYVYDISDSKFTINNPMLIDVDIDMKSSQQAFVIKSWMPHQLYKNKEVSIWTNDILFISEPSDVFVEYYEKMIKKIEQYIIAEQFMDEMEDDELYLAMNELDSGVPIH